MLRSHSEPIVALSPASKVILQFRQIKDKKRAGEGEMEARQTGQSRVHMISAAAADWQAAGSRGTDCDPKDVARMVEDYVIEEKKGRTPHHSKISHRLLNTTELTAFQQA